MQPTYQVFIGQTVFSDWNRRLIESLQYEIEAAQDPNSKLDKQYLPDPSSVLRIVSENKNGATVEATLNIWQLFMNDAKWQIDPLCDNYASSKRAFKVALTKIAAAVEGEVK